MRLEIRKNKNVRNLVKKVSSNLMRAQIEENKDISARNKYLEQAGFDSIQLSRLLQELGDNYEASRYLLSAAHSYEKPSAITQARACLQKVIEIGEPDFVDKAKEELSHVDILKKKNIDLETKEGRLAALDFIIWEHRVITTPEAVNYFFEEFDKKNIDPQTIRNYARELEERKRIVVWGGPSGRVYHMYPNIAELATRSQHYGFETLVKGVVERRVTDSFTINFKTWKYNKELFVINCTIIPSMLMAVDMEAFVKNLEMFMKPNYSVKAIGSLERFSDLVNRGYDSSSFREKDVFDSQKLIDKSDENLIYVRDT